MTFSYATQASLLLAIALLSGCAQLGQIDQLAEDTSQIKIRQDILLSPSVFGVAAHLQKKKLLKHDKNVQEAKVMPLLDLLREKNENQIHALLGQPVRKLREGQAQVWQYVTDICQWDLYFLGSETMEQAVLKNVIIHHQGEILTESTEIAECETTLRAQQSTQIERA